MSLLESVMESAKHETRSVPDSRTVVGDPSVNDENSRSSTSAACAPTNGLTNGIHLDDDGNATGQLRKIHSVLRTTLSCEENDDNELRDDEGERNNMETGSCPKYKSCRDRIGNEMFEMESPSCSGAASHRLGLNDQESLGSEARRSRKRAADCRAERSNLNEDASSSDTSNDDYSLGSEDGCIYTYRGGEHLADLPSSFFSLDMGLPRDNHLPAPPAYAARAAQEAPGEERRGSRASSPDMDYLEMDFDPGPSCEADSGEESSPEVDLEASPSPELQERMLPARETTPDAGAAAHNVSEHIPVTSPKPSTLTYKSWGTVDASQPSTSRAGASTVEASGSESQPADAACVRAGLVVPHVNARGERLLVRRTCRRWPPRAPVTHHTSSGDLVCERSGTEGASLADTASSVDRVNLSCALYHCTMAKKLIVEKPNAEFMESADTSNLSESEGGAEIGCGEARVCEVERCMVWSEREACERQVTQISTSACGATAVLNTFLALGIPIDTEKINKAVGTRLRANDAPIPRYLLSRAVAGCTAAGLIAGLQQASEGLVTARFFPTYPERVVSLSHWLADWISLGAVPIATLNLQACREGEPASEIPDAWHHQMVFGVSPRGVFLTNPVECVPECQLWPQLCSDSVLLVRSRDVLARLTSTTDLTPLMTVPDPRWATFNVLGQVVNVMRESRECETSGGCSESHLRAQHVRVPCAYRAGVTLATLTGSEAHRRLTKAHHLPLLATSRA